MNTISKAVEPMRAEAIAASREMAIDQLKRIQACLEEAGWDLDKAAPRPKGNVSRADYVRAKNRVNLFASLTKPAPGQHLCRRVTDPDIRVWSTAAADLYVQYAARDASAQYDLYVGNLTKKVGDGVLTADMSYVSGIWYNSLLTVTKEDGTTERWKTSCIINISVLGKVFNQWPTRKVK